MRFKCQDLTSPNESGQTYTPDQMNINNEFQRLWTQLSVFIRSYIYAVLLNLPNTEAEAERLFNVPADFHTTFQTFYGPEIADKMTEMMTNFLSGLPQVLEGEMTNNQQLVNQGVQQWYQNADKLANFLDNINIFWNTKQWQNLLYQYISLNLAMITSIATKDYKHAIEIYERIVDIASIMGTYMAYGLFAEELQKKK